MNSPKSNTMYHSINLIIIQKNNQSKLFSPMNIQTLG